MKFRFLFWEFSCRFVGLKKSLDRRLIDLLDEGKKIPAIQLYRAETGSGLFDAKKYVDALDEKRKKALLDKHGLV